MSSQAKGAAKNRDGIAKVELSQKLGISINTLGKKLDNLKIETETDPMDSRVKRIRSKDLRILLDALRVDQSYFSEFIKD